MITRPRPTFPRPSAFTFVEAIFTIAIIGIMSALALSAISNGARDANRIVARQQQAAVQEALNDYVMNQMRQNVTDTTTGKLVARLRSLNSIRNSYNALTTTVARFNLLVPNPTSSDSSVRTGYLDQTTADHFLDYTTGSDRIYSAALKGSFQYLSLPTWQDGGYPSVDLVNE